MEDGALVCKVCLDERQRPTQFCSDCNLDGTMRFAEYTMKDGTLLCEVCRDERFRDFITPIFADDEYLICSDCNLDGIMRAAEYKMKDRGGMLDLCEVCLDERVEAGAFLIPHKGNPG